MRCCSAAPRSTVPKLTTPSCSPPQLTMAGFAIGPHQVHVRVAPQQRQTPSTPAAAAGALLDQLPLSTVVLMFAAAIVVCAQCCGGQKRDGQETVSFADRHRQGYGAGGQAGGRSAIESPERNVEMGAVRSSRRQPPRAQHGTARPSTRAADDGRLNTEMEQRAAGRDRRRERYTGRNEADDSAASFRC